MHVVVAVPVTHGLAGGKQLRLRINSLGAPEEFIDAVERFFEHAEAA